eukprot:Nitzschia sp. Nitz4//scaffold22_size323478//317811//319128//NITZ4_000598-RA/size323478-snap-gene-0.575-mRNA-1//-1//CDS//3329543210//3414//frame0
MVRRNDDTNDSRGISTSMNSRTDGEHQLSRGSGIDEVRENQNSQSIFRRVNDRDFSSRSNSRVMERHDSGVSPPEMTGGNIPRNVVCESGGQYSGYSDHRQQYEYPPPQSTPSCQYHYPTAPGPCYSQYPGFGTPPPPHVSYPYYHQPWGPPTMAPYIDPITDVKPHDVLSGRGGATNSHSGNRAFRQLVKEYQSEYLAAKKRDKPSVAAIIVDKIREKGGRFLKKYSTSPDGQVLWMEIGDDRAKEKTAQALREGAPEIRRKRKASSSDEEDMKHSLDETGNKESISPRSSFGRSVSNDDSTRSTSQKLIAQNSSSGHDDSHSSTIHQSGSIMIVPSVTLLRRRVAQPIAVDQLGPEEREIYLRDFLPPDPCIRQKRGPPACVLNASVFSQSPNDTCGDQSNSPWPIVRI